MKFVYSTCTLHLTEEERKILELALPILIDLDYESESFAMDEIVYCLYQNYRSNNGKLSVEIDLDKKGIKYEN